MTHPAIRTIREGSRGCGDRKLGGLYLMLDGTASSCGKLPVSLKLLNQFKCPSCGETHELPPDYGVRPSRAPRMLQNPELLWADIECHAEPRKCRTCPLSNGFECGPALLIWIGEVYYQTPEEFLTETRKMGISRRIPHIPEGFVVGESWCLFAHSKAIKKSTKLTESVDWFGGAVELPRETDEYEAGVFAMFKPSRIEKVVTGDESDEEIDRLVERGITPVIIEKLKQAQLEPDQPNDEDELE